MIALGIAVVFLLVFLLYEEPEERRKRMSEGRRDAMAVSWNLDHDDKRSKRRF